MWNKRWNGIFARSLTERSLSDVPSSLVELIPFDVSIALTQQDRGVDSVALSQIVNSWLNKNFRDSVNELSLEGDYYDFDQIILKNRNKRRLRALQTTFLATYEANSVWKQTLPVPDETTVAAIQLEALLDRAGLEEMLREASPSTGLGQSVVAVRATLNRENDSGPDDNLPESSGGNDSLNTVIIVAVVIAVLALVLLGFALFMAWRTNRQQRPESSPTQERRKKSRMVGSPGASKETTHASSKGRSSSPVPSEIAPSDEGTGVYPNSIISDDINSSLTAYYQSGMAGGHKANKHQGGGLNDAASVSSMESYGYSLDGYASSIAPENKGN